MPLSENMAVVTYQVVMAKKRIDSFCSIMKGSIDTSTATIREEGYRTVDELLTRLLLKGEPELMKLMKSPRATQDRYIAKMRRSFGLTGKPVDLAKSKTVRELRLPKATEMFKDLQKGKQIGSISIRKEEDVELETCIINHMDNDGMAREEAMEACRKDTGETEDREAALSREDKSKSTEAMFKALMKKKGHNF